jgi:dTDP-D-glucose 4,6-dehydratase
MPERQWDTKSWMADSRRIQRELGWRSRYTFEQGFRETLEWFQSQPEIQELYKRLLTQAVSDLRR